MSERKLMRVANGRHRIVPRSGYTMPAGCEPAYVVERREAFAGDWSPIAVVLRRHSSDHEGFRVTPGNFATLVARLPEIIYHVEMLAGDVLDPTSPTKFSDLTISHADSLARLLGVRPDGANGLLPDEPPA